MVPGQSEDSRGRPAEDSRGGPAEDSGWGPSAVPETAPRRAGRSELSAAAGPSSGWLRPWVH